MSFNSGSTTVLEDRNLYALNLSKDFVFNVDKKNPNECSLTLDNQDISIVAMVKHELDKNINISGSAFVNPHPCETLVKLIAMKKKDAPDQKITLLEIIRDGFKKNKEVINSFKQQILALKQKNSKNKMEISIDLS